MGQVVSASTVTSGTTALRPAFQVVGSHATSGAGTRPVFQVGSSNAAQAAVVGYTGWSSLGCYQDTLSNQKLLASYTFTDASMDVKLCESMCRGMGFNIAGVESGSTCNCGTGFSHCASTVAATSCSSTCAGSPTQSCGGSNVMNIYAVSGYSFSSTACSTIAPTTTAKSTTNTSTSKSTTTTSTSKLTGTTTATSTTLKTATSKTASASSTSSTGNTSTSKKGTTSTSTIISTTSLKSTKTTITSKSSTTSSSKATYTVGATYTGVPQAKGANKVFAHYMIGNMYPVTTVSAYQSEIQRAINMGIDGFACNIGSEGWQADRLSLMYQAAEAFPGFVIFVSLDMAVLAGTSMSYFYQFITPYTSHPNQYTIDGLQFLSTFAGESYKGVAPDPTFTDPAAAWLYFKNQLSSMGTEIYFVPSFTGAGATVLGWDALDGAMSWNAWTTSTGEDSWYQSLSASSSSGPTTGTGANSLAHYTGKTYMAGIGPLFFTHFYYKNQVYGQDDMYTTRWENLVSSQPDFIEIISWNDYGESHYIGDIYGALPYDDSSTPTIQSSDWANSDFDHSPLAGLTKYYIQAYKARGVYPTITKNQLYMWYRPHSISAVASADPVAKPQYIQPSSGDSDPVDNIYFTALLTQATTFTVQSGTSSQTFQCAAGKCHFHFVNFSEGKPQITATVGGSAVLSKQASLAINNTITKYNFNLHMENFSW